MANFLRTLDGNFVINWVRRTSKDGQAKLHFTLSGKSGAVIGKAVMTADYIKDYIIMESISEAKEARIVKLYKELEELLSSAPSEDECEDKEVDMYSEMANLYQAIADYKGF